MRERKVRLSSLLIALFVLAVIFLGLQQVAIGRSDALILLLFGIGIFFFLSCLLSELNKRPYSFQMIFWLFSLFFFGFAPLLQYLSDTFSWDLSPSENEILLNNVLILVWSLLFYLGVRLADRLPDRKTFRRQIRMDLPKRLLVMLVCLGIMSYDLITVGLSNIFFRSTNTGVTSGSSAIDLVLQNGLRNVLLFSVVLSIINIRRKKKIDFIDLAIFISFIIGCFPTGIPRYMFAAFYGGLLAIAFPGSRQRRWYSFLIIFGLVLVFPVMSLFRNASSFGNGDLLELVSDRLTGTYLSGDYDSYQMFISVRRYVQAFGITHGRQLLGVLLFFVPRAFWPAKPIGTGSTVISALNQFYFTNVSAPLVSEAYVNFGIIGILIVPLLLGVACALLDRSYWQEKEKGISYLKFVYPFAMLYFFFMLRGDLMSSWAYVFANLFIGYLMYRFACLR